MKKIIVVFCLTGLLPLISYSATSCSSDQNGEGDLLSINKEELSIKDIRVNDLVLLNGKKVKVVEFYSTGGPEDGITVISSNGKKFDMWCSDEDTPTDN
ncbi:MAG: hypothetical protein H7328_06880 [Bdellovibrio sp.]|nr:hypothetical protein [Bdellovibrio sp.]